MPSIGGNISSGNDIMVQGAWDQKGGDHIWNFTDPMPLSVRNDVVVFQTEPLEQDIEVTGEIVVKLWASSSAVDTDFTAKLLDVYPPSPDFPGIARFIRGQAVPDALHVHFNGAGGNIGVSAGEDGVILIDDHLYGHSDNGGWKCWRRAVLPPKLPALRPGLL